MVKIIIVGGRLQGVEAAYLARMQGYDSVVVDLDEYAPAARLCSQFVRGNALDQAFMAKLCRGADLILPAMENQQVLDALERISVVCDVPLVYDRKAYAISSNKRASDRMFAQLGIPAPIPWPECGFPVVAKPTGASGSQGVVVLENKQELQAHQRGIPREGLVVQQYLDGPSFSIEVIGNGREYATLQITELFMDLDYDCKRVLAPVQLSGPLQDKFRESALCIARTLNIKGIFDVEAILSDGEFKILEIDARLPSQTPTAVYHSTGINMLELLMATAKGESLVDVELEERRACLYEHIHVRDGNVSVCGEHIMGSFGPLRLAEGLWGADTAITSYTPGAREWVATMIYWGGTRSDVMKRHNQTVSDINSKSSFYLRSNALVRTIK